MTVLSARWARAAVPPAADLHALRERGPLPLLRAAAAAGRAEHGDGDRVRGAQEVEEELGVGGQAGRARRRRRAARGAAPPGPATARAGLRVLAGVRAHLWRSGATGQDRDDRAAAAKDPRGVVAGRRGPRHVHGPRGRGRPARGAHRPKPSRLRRPDLPGVRGSVHRRGPPAGERHTT